MSDRAQEIRALMESSGVRAFLKRHHEVETAPRWQCPECQFEQNEHYASHAPGCSRVSLASRGDA